MHAMEGAFKVFLEGVEGDFERGLAGDQNVVVSGARCCFGDGSDGGFEAAADAIALDCAADGFGDGETEPGLLRARRKAVTWLRFQNKRGRWAPGPAPDAQEFGSLLEGGKFHRSHPGLRRAPGAPRPAARPKGAYGPWRGGGQGPGRHLAFPCACGSHGDACAQACWVDTCASRYSPSRRYTRLAEVGKRPRAGRFGCKFNFLPENVRWTATLVSGPNPFRQEWKTPLYRGRTGSSQSGDLLAKLITGLPVNPGTLVQQQRFRDLVQCL